MPDNTKPIKCSPCDLVLKGAINPDGQEWHSCPNCGVGDTPENIMREVKEYAKDQAKDFLNREMATLAKSSKFISVNKAFSAAKNHRFKVEMDI